MNVNDIRPDRRGSEPRESQRDSATKPRVARNELPWVNEINRSNPERVVAQHSMAIDKVATERGIYAASAYAHPRISVDLSSSNFRTLKRHKCRAPSATLSAALHGLLLHPSPYFQIAFIPRFCFDSRDYSA